MKKVFLYCFLFVLFLWAFHGCGGVPRDALKMKSMTLEEKRLQTRLFDTTDERKILSASEGILQVLGFKLVESEMDLGLIVGTQDRNAIKAGQVLLAAIWTALDDTPATNSQKIRISIVSSPAGENGKQTSVRVTFQQIVWDDYGRLCKLERLNIPELYRGFFAKLSKAVRLKAHSSRFGSSRSRILAAQKSQIKLRGIHTRVLDTTDKIKTLRAVMATVQDLGFVINKADDVLGSVTATKLDHYAVRIIVNVLYHDKNQMLVRANAQYNFKSIEYPELYQQFFAALEIAIFSAAHNAE
jgi:hypothetical protein